MKKVITYGSFDTFHYGHKRLLERAKALGDYLIVGVTSDNYDRTRGKMNAKQSLMERIENVRALGIADEIIVEEYDGQKIDDIKRFGVDIFTVGSDWVGKFDYLKEYCEVIYLERTPGISSTAIRSENRHVRLGLMAEGNGGVLSKIWNEAEFVNGLVVSAVCSDDEAIREKAVVEKVPVVEDYERLLYECDAVYVLSLPEDHYKHVKAALQKGRHVICESPLAETEAQCRELFDLARRNKLMLFDGIKTAYSTAYHRLVLLAKTGIIGNVVSVDATCSSLVDMSALKEIHKLWSAFDGWGPTALLPIFQILGTDYKQSNICRGITKENFEGFVKLDFVFDKAVASAKVAKCMKSEGELIISGTKGYIYVPAPWWKTDYFEVRRENQTENRRYFYSLEGEGIRYELVSFMKSIETGRNLSSVDEKMSLNIVNTREKVIHHNMNIIIN